MHDAGDELAASLERVPGTQQSGCRAGRATIERRWPNVFHQSYLYIAVAQLLPLEASSW